MDKVANTVGHYETYRKKLDTLQDVKLLVPDVNTDNNANNEIHQKDANKLIGRIVVWITPSGKELKGVITRAHGNNGAVRAHFKKAGVPGQALGNRIKIIK